MSNKFYEHYFTINETTEAQNKAEYTKMGLWFFMMYFDGWISFILNQNNNNALILDHYVNH